MATIIGTSGQRIERKYLQHYIDVSGGGSTPSWEIVGRGVEDSSIELNTEVTKSQDILGYVDTSVDSMLPEQSYDPNTLRVGNALSAILHELFRNRDYSGFSNFKILTVYTYMLEDESETTEFSADMESNCTIEISSLGGSSYVDMPFIVHHSNEITKGTVTFTAGVPTFTASL